MTATTVFLVLIFFATSAAIGFVITFLGSALLSWERLPVLWVLVLMLCVGVDALLRATASPTLHEWEELSVRLPTLGILVGACYGAYVSRLVERVP